MQAFLLSISLLHIMHVVLR
jgi:hypothetical protein